MSRLSRFKKAPVLKFPSSKPKVQQRGRFDDDSDDDDFKAPISTFSNRHTGKEKPSQKLPNEKRNSQVEEEYTDLGETSTSAYFRHSSRKTEEKVKESGKCNNDLISEPNPNNYRNPKEAGKEVTNTISTTATKSKSKAERDRNHKEDLQEDKKSVIKIADKRREATSHDEDKRTKTDKADSNENQVVCPFCWKKLGDKLSGTTHVKSCAKDLPTERVFEAIQLQEKQIQEWEKLGLTFPGFSTAAAKPSKSSSAATRGKGDRRRKKANDVGSDPQLELAMALSESLHEEMNSRRIKENQFLIENGLEKEIGLTETLQARPSSSVSGPGNMVSGAAAVRTKTTTEDSAAPTTTVSRRRGKKVDLQNLPLYTTDINQKRAIIGERVARILEDSDKKSHESFYIRDEIPSSKLKVPKSLKSAINKDATLWKLAQSSEDASEKSFSTLELKEVTEVFETSKYSPSKTDDIHISPENSKKMSSPVITSAKLPSNKTSLYTNQSPNKKPKDQISPSLEGERKVNEPASCKVSQSSSISGKDKRSLKNLPPVVQAIAKMLTSGQGSDITCYGREEKPINCHRFMLQARCPRLLDEVVVQSVEGNSRRSKRDIIPLTDYGHSAVKALLWFIYTGSFQLSDQALVDEVKSLGGAYGIIVETATSTNAGLLETTKVEKMSTTVEAEVQTEVLIRKDCETTTDDLLNCEIACKNNTEKSFVDFDETSEELFTTLDFEAENNRKHLPSLTTSLRKSLREENCEEDENILDKAIDPEEEEIEDGNSSVDIFEKSDASDNEDPQPVERKTDKSVRGCPSPQIFQTDTSRPQTDECRTIDDEDDFDYLKDLATPPETQHSINASNLGSEKKRSRSPSRSPSPLFNDDVSYTATQMADLLHSKRNGGLGLTDEFKKANKKQKIDYSIYKSNDFDFNSEMEVELMDVNVSETVDKCGNGNNKHSKSCSRESENNSVMNFQTPISIKTRNRNSLRRSASSPSLSLSSHRLNRSPFLPQVNEVEEYDPFADDCDDSIFAKIPDEVFSRSKQSPIKPLPEDPDHHSLHTNASNLHSRSDVPSEIADIRQNQKPLSPLQESSSYQDEFTDSRKATGSQKGKTKAKAKPSCPKLKLPSKRTNKKDADSGVSATTTRSFSQPTAKTSKPSKPCDNSKSPMLNYSLIDTPVLKQELKKFGIKPLPRSKAKVLLRHIYKETHQ